MSDQIRSMLIVLLVFMFMFTGLVTFFHPTFIGSLGMGVLGVLVGYNFGLLDKFELK